MYYATIYMCNHMYAVDYVTDSENTLATQKEMTWTHPNQSLNNLISLLILYSIWQLQAFPYIQAARKAAKHQSKNLSSKRALLIQLIYSCVLVTIFPPIMQLHCLHINPHTTHNSSNRSDEELTLETSAFTLFTVANLRFQLSC